MERQVSGSLLACLAITLSTAGFGYADEPEIRAFAPLPEIATVVPKDNPQTDEKVELGKLLYFDPRLSGDSTRSCATCHVPQDGWTERSQLSTAYTGTKHWRHTSSVLNSTYMQHLFWDGRARSLEEQVKGPIVSPIEMNQNPAHLVEKLSQVPEYQKRFKAVFDGPVTIDNISMAIAAFERTVVSRNVPFDKYLRGDKSALSAEQIAGLKLFTTKAGCVQCHYGPNLTDQRFHALGVPETEPLKKESDRIATRHFFAREQGYKGSTGDFRIEADYGRELITKSQSDRLRFATKSLREVAVTAPYMHNGAFKTLEEVVAFFNRGGGEIREKDPLIRPRDLSEAECGALIAFLKSLSGDPIVIQPPELPKKADGSF